MSLYISKVSEDLIQHVSVKKCQDEKNGQRRQRAFRRSAGRNADSI